MKRNYHETPEKHGKNTVFGERRGIEENLIRELYRRSREKLAQSFDWLEEGFFPGDLCDLAIEGRRIC
jgi:hypothetical protein